MLATQLKAWDELQDTKGNKQIVVFELIKSSEDGKTLFELVRDLGWSVNRISGRVTELRGYGMIVDSGVRRRNPESGKCGVVWIAAEKLARF